MVIPARTAVLAFVVVAAFLTLGAQQLEAAPNSFASCPRTDKTVIKTSLPGSGSELVPSGSTGVLLCRYHGLNPSSRRNRLIASGKVTAAASVAKLAKTLNALPKAVGIRACPADFDSLIVAYFHYRAGGVDAVTVDTSGCGMVSNGHLTRTASPALVQQLERMTR